MIYLRSSKRSSLRGYGKYFPVLALLVLLAGLFFLFRVGAQSLGFRTLSPFFKVYNSLVQNIKLGSRIFVPDFTLEKENVVLNSEVARLRQQALDLEVARLENEELRQRLEEREPNYLSTYILLSPPRTPYDTVVIDRGKYDGVAVDQRVILGRRVALGVIEEVFSNQSTVKLFTTPEHKTEAVIERTGAIVELVGQGGGNFKLEVPLDFDVKEGDLILLQGSPRRLLASVVEAKTDEASSFLTVFLRTPSPLLGDSPLYVEVLQ